MTITYSCDRDGNIVKTVHNKGRYTRIENEGLPFDQKMLRNYYALECSGELAPGTNKNKIKRTWELDGMRREARVGEHALGD